jgi:hypothetical protein
LWHRPQHKTPSLEDFCTNPNNSEEFAEEIEVAIASNFLVEGDMLMLDKVTMHNHGAEIQHLEKWILLIKETS